MNQILDSFSNWLFYIDSRYTDVACFGRVGIGRPLTTYGAAKIITSLRAGTNLSLALNDTPSNRATLQP